MKWPPNLRQVFKWDSVQRSGKTKSEAKKRNTHLPEFSAKVGLEAVRGGKTVNQMAQESGVHPVQVGQWKREIQAECKTLFEGKRGPQTIAAHSAPDRRYGEIGRLKMELDWLKKVRDQPAMTRRIWIGMKQIVHLKMAIGLCIVT